MSRLKELLSLWAHVLCAWLTGFFPRRRNRIVFCNYNGRGYGDNLSPIADEVIRRGHNWDLVWLVKDESVDLPRFVRKVKRGWLREKACLASARVVISNTKGSLIYRKHPGSVYLQTWHGGDLPTKFVEGGCGLELSRYYVMMSKRDSKITDYVLSGSVRLTEIFLTEFWYPKTCQVLEWGTPRKDIYFKKSGADKAKIREEIFGRGDVKVALYAPTFREYISNECCKFDFEFFRRALEKKFGGSWVVVIRLHPNVANLANRFPYDEKIINGTGMEDGQLLCLVSDLLVTDYSSIMEDFVVQRKPIILFTPDIDDYLSHERKLRDFYLNLPFARCRTEEELMDAVSRLDVGEYLKLVSDFAENGCKMVDDGHASERVVDLIEKLMA